MSTTLRVGYIPLIDASLLVAARNQGFAAAEGIDLVLVRDVTWANLRDRLATERLDAAHMLAPAAIASTLGVGQFPIAMAAPICLNRNGNAITLSPGLHAEVLRHCAGDPSDPAATAASLRTVIQRRRRDGLPELVFAMVYPFSMHAILLNRWFRLADIDPREDLQLTVLPPQFMVTGIERGLIDGFCAGAPWNALAVDGGSGAIIHAGTEVIGDAPEKLLVWRAADLAPRSGAVAALNRAIMAASRWCADEANWPRLAEDLANPAVLGAPASTIHKILRGDTPIRRTTAQPLAFLRLDPAILRPSPDDADFLYRHMQTSHMLDGSEAGLAIARNIFRADIYDAATPNPRASTPSPSGRGAG